MKHYLYAPLLPSFLPMPVDRGSSLLAALPPSLSAHFPRFPAPHPTPPRSKLQLGNPARRRTFRTILRRQQAAALQLDAPWRQFHRGASATFARTAVSGTGRGALTPRVRNSRCVKSEQPQREGRWTVPGERPSEGMRALSGGGNESRVSSSAVFGH